MAIAENIDHFIRRLSYRRAEQALEAVQKSSREDDCVCVDWIRTSEAIQARELAALEFAFLKALVAIAVPDYEFKD